MTDMSDPPQPTVEPPAPPSGPVAPPATYPGYPADDGQPGWSMPPSAPSQGTNGFAIAALIFGIIGGVLFSVICAIVALKQIKKRGQGGRGLAIAGLVLSGIWVLIIGAAAAFLVAGSPDRDASGQIVGGGSVSADEVKVGDCLKTIPADGALGNVDLVPCGEAHEGETFALFALPDGSWPGDEAIFTKAEEGCSDRVDAALPKLSATDEIGLIYFHPTSVTWKLGDRDVTCIAVFDPARTGSLR